MRYTPPSVMTAGVDMGRRTCPKPTCAVSNPHQLSLLSPSDTPSMSSDSLSLPTVLRSQWRPLRDVARPMRPVESGGICGVVLSSSWLRPWYLECTKLYYIYGLCWFVPFGFFCERWMGFGMLELELIAIVILHMICIGVDDGCSQKVRGFDWMID